MQHLDIEPQTYDQRREQEPAQAAFFGGEAHAPGRQEQSEHQQTIGGVIAVRDHADGCEGQRQGRDQSRRRAKDAAHQEIEQRDGEHASDCLRQQYAQSAEAEDFRAYYLYPQT